MTKKSYQKHDEILPF